MSIYPKQLKNSEYLKSPTVNAKNNDKNILNNNNIVAEKSLFDFVADLNVNKEKQKEQLINLKSKLKCIDDAINFTYNWQILLNDPVVNKQSLIKIANFLIEESKNFPLIMINKDIIKSVIIEFNASQHFKEDFNYFISLVDKRVLMNKDDLDFYLLELSLKECLEYPFCYKNIPAIKKNLEENDVKKKDIDINKTTNENRNEHSMSSINQNKNEYKKDELKEVVKEDNEDNNKEEATVDKQTISYKNIYNYFSNEKYVLEYCDKQNIVNTNEIINDSKYIYNLLDRIDNSKNMIVDIDYLIKQIADLDGKEEGEKSCFNKQINEFLSKCKDK